jgi:DNA-binding FadR family transcriptional regulator
MVDSIMDIMENNVSTIPISAASIKRTLRYHEDILAALMKWEADRAQRVMLEHIQGIHAALDSGRSRPEGRKSD